MSKLIRKTLIIAGVNLTAYLLFFVAAASAASVPAPKYVRLEPLTEKLNKPTDVDIDDLGNILVVESGSDRLLIFSAEGEYIKQRGGLATPISVAVGSDGKIYVGNVGRKNVEIFDGQKLKLLGELGKGRGEFYKPTSIELDADDNVYVADGDADAVKVYDSMGKFKFNIGESGYGDGKFNFPSALAIDRAAGELIVTDLQRTQSADGEHGGARIQIFTLDGEFKKSFGSYGVGEAELVRPLGVAVDKLGRIYATDALQQVVKVYTKEGDYLGAVFDASNPMITPLGVDYCELTSRLFVASSNTKKVEIFGIDDYKTFVKKDQPPADVTPVAEEPTPDKSQQDAKTTDSSAGSGSGKCFISTMIDN